MLYFALLSFLFFFALRTEAFELKTKAQIEDFITHVAMQQGVSVELALGIARCESNFNPLAKNPHSSAGGIMQFIDSTWASTNRRMGWDGVQDKFDARLNIVAGIWLLKTDGPRHWECFTEDLIAYAPHI